MKAKRLALAFLVLVTSHHAAYSTDSESNSPSETLARALRVGDQELVRFKDGTSRTFTQLSRLTSEQRDLLRQQIVRRSEWSWFVEWELKVAQARADEQATKAREAKARLAETDARIAAKTKALHQGYETYVANMERGARGERAFLQKIIAEESLHKTVRDRASALLDSKSARWLD